jgi:hypothetical protein
MQSIKSWIPTLTGIFLGVIFMPLSGNYLRSHFSEESWYGVGACFLLLMMMFFTVYFLTVFVLSDLWRPPEGRG